MTDNGGIETMPREIVLSEDITGVVDAAEAALIHTNAARVFQRAGQLVEICRDKPPARLKFLRYPAGAPVAVPIRANRLLELLGQVAVWKKPGTAGRKGETTKPPREVALTLLERPSYDVDPLRGISEVPVFRDDGSIFATPGYDERTGIVFASKDTFPEIPLRPTQDDARNALAVLTEPLVNFPFQPSHHIAVALSVALTLLARHAIAGPTPLHHVDSPTAGTGKTRLIEALCASINGRTPPVLLLPPKPDEAIKILFSLGMSSSSVAFLDNLPSSSPFGGVHLAAAITTATIESRAMYRSEMVSARINPLWVSTGNNIRFKDDLGRRTLLCRLDAGIENPEDRDDFRYPNLIEAVLELRPQIVAAGLTILRAFTEAGRPGHGLSRMGSFERWDDHVRAPLIWVDDLDPCESREAVRDDADEQRDRARVMIHAWRDSFGDHGATVAEANRRTNEDEDLLHAFQLIQPNATAGKFTSALIGRALAEIAGRIVDGCKIEKVGKTRHRAQVWRVVCVDAAAAANVRL